MKPEDNLIYWTKVKKFKKRVWILFAPYLIIYVFLVSLAVLNVKGYKLIIVSWIIFISLIALAIFIFCYRWALNKITKISEIEGGLEIEMMTKDKMRRRLVSDKNLKIASKRIGRCPSLLKLTLSDGDKKIIDMYTPGNFRELCEVEKLKYELNKYLGTVHN